MQLKERLKTQLEKVRGMSEGMLASFKEPKEWTYQVAPTANHALWFAGHMGGTDNFFLATLDPSKAIEKPGYQERFGMGSRPVDDPSAYPPVEEVLDFMRERRQALLAVLDAMSDEDLARPVPEEMTAMGTDWASLLEMAVWHESLHAGQVSIARRALGNNPLLGAA
jgi:uncharacterized damage-inducible protein DinB